MHGLSNLTPQESNPTVYVTAEASKGSSRTAPVSTDAAFVACGQRADYCWPVIHRADAAQKYVSRCFMPGLPSIVQDR